jgi:aspartyl protease
VTRRLLAGALALLLVAPVALAEWLQPDASYRDAQLLLRQALRDTMGRGSDPARLDSLGVAQLRLARFDQARAAFARVLAIDPRDGTALAAYGKLALFADRTAEAESLLSLAAAAPAPDPDVLADLYAARLRLGRYAAAAELAPQVGDQARVAMLELLAATPPYRIASGPDEAKAPWSKGYPVPLLRVKLGGQSVLMALDTGANDLIIDPTYARMAGVKMLPSKSLVFWNGARIAVQHGMVPRIELGGVRIEDVPAGVVGLRKWMQQVNPQAEPVAGIIGLGLLRRFTPTLDYREQVLELRRPGIAYPVGPNARRIPFEIWGEAELTVYGSLNGGRRMAMIVQSGLHGCGVGAPSDVLAEVGVKPGKVARAFKGAGSVLQGAPWAAVNLPIVAVGPLVRNKVRGWSGALDGSELWRHGVRRDAILSHDFFKGDRVTIDWQARELVVEGKD